MATQDDDQPEDGAEFLNLFLAEYVEYQMKAIRAMTESIELQEPLCAASGMLWSTRVLKMLAEINRISLKTKRIVSSYAVNEGGVSLSESARIQSLAPNSVKKYAAELFGEMHDILMPNSRYTGAARESMERQQQALGRYKKSPMATIKIDRLEWMLRNESAREGNE
ncbi:hypothetical protein OG216_24045 [Streptomycetaceae bacterium NBC_01309]